MPKDILLPQDRKVLCEYLLENATDEIILRAVQDSKEYRMNVQSDFEGVRKFIGPSRFFNSPAAKQPSVTMETVQAAKVAVATTPKTSEYEPPGTPAKRIGSSTLEQIKRLLTKKPATIEDINICINGTISNTASLMKLLWVRKTVGYNNKEFHLT